MLIPHYEKGTLESHRNYVGIQTIRLFGRPIWQRKTQALGSLILDQPKTVELLTEWLLQQNCSVVTANHDNGSALDV
jgi:hypothetical protein